MEMIGDYEANGYAHVRALISPQVAQAFLSGLQQDLGDGPIALSNVRDFPNLLARPAFEIYGHHYRPMIAFLWGLTPVVSELLGRELLPTYDYLRIYREGDVCRVHFDRPSCEHSMSLTLDYSDGEPWALDVGRVRYPEPNATTEEGFGAEDFASITMEVGDAVLYRGTNRRHGRVTPNPNGWSAHLFLHWVDANGPYRDHAFDGRADGAPVNFSFA